MRRQIVFTEIRLNLDNFTDVFDAGGVMNEPFSKEFLRDADGIAVIKWAWQFGHGGRLMQFPV